MGNIPGFILDVADFITASLALYALLIITPIDWILVFSQIAAMLVIVATAIVDAQSSPMRPASAILHVLAIVLRIGAFYTLGFAFSLVASVTNTAFQGLLIAAAIIDVMAYFVARATRPAKTPAR